MQTVNGAQIDILNLNLAFYHLVGVLLFNFSQIFLTLMA